MKVWPEKLSNDGTNNYKLLMLSIKNEFNLQHIFSMDEEEVSLCQAGMIFTKDLSNCQSTYEFGIKPNTGICPQGLLWNMVDEKKCGEQKTIFFKSLEEKKIQNFPNYEKQYSKNLKFLKVEIESMEKECLLPILQLPNGFLKRSEMKIKKKKTMFLVEEVLKAKRITVSWRKEGVEGSQSFSQRVIGMKYRKMKINENGMFWMEELSRKN